MENISSSIEATSVIELMGDSADVDVDENSETRSSVTLRAWLLKRLWGLASLTLFLLTLTTTVGLLARHHWIADLCANLRNQQVIALAALLLIVILYRRWRWLALSVVLMAIHLPWYAKVETFAMGLVLDHCLISDGLQCVSHSAGADIGSDHRAVIVGLKSRK